MQALLSTVPRPHVSALVCRRQLSSCPLGVYDVVVVGAGVVGAAFACLVGSTPRLRACRVLVVEPVEPKPLHPLSDLPSMRVSTITPYATRILQEAGVWETIRATRAVSFTRMQVWHEAGGGYVRFNAEDLGEKFLGHCIENHVIQDALFQRLRKMGGVDVESPASLSALRHETDVLPEEEEEEEEEEEKEEISGSNLLSLVLDDGRKVKTRLLVGADGGRSVVRQLANIPSYGWDYTQSAIVCNVLTDGPHDTAWQRFLPTGPIALLPLFDSYSSIVWSTTPEHAKDLLSVSKEDLAHRLNAALAPPDLSGGLSSVLGQMLPWGLSESTKAHPPPRIVDVVGDRGAFPLRMAHAMGYTRPRLALIGDAAHSIHPMAGHGMNLGLYDARALATALEDASSQGVDLGDPTILRNFSRRRLASNLVFMSGQEGIKRMFDSSFSPIQHVRDLGMKILNRTPPLKRQLIRYAMGVDVFSGHVREGGNE